MARDLELAIKITSEVSQPQAQLRQLGAELRDLGEKAGLSEQEMQALSDEIDRLAREQGLINTFRVLKQQAKDRDFLGLHPRSGALHQRLAGGVVLGQGAGPSWGDGQG